MALLERAEEFVNSVHPVVGASVAIVVAAFVGLVVHALLFAAARRVSSRTPSEMDDEAIRRFRAPSRLAIPLLAVQVVLPRLPVSEGVSGLLGHLLSLGLIGAITWAAVRAVTLFERWLLREHRIDVADNLEARRMHTQVKVLGRTISILVAIVGISVALMTFPQVRQVGASLLASAGIAGIAVGLAARPLITNLIAGIQIALTEPIRLDDVVIVEGEWGRVEEFTATYVVIRIWDDRRLVVPLGYFLEKPFQNWTRRTADLLGTVYLHLDYEVPVPRIREELERLVKDDEDWDGRVQGVQVTNTSPEAVEVRALVSAGDASKAWNLRCRVREGLIDFLQREYPASLPRTRVSVRPIPGASSEEQKEA